MKSEDIRYCIKFLLSRSIEDDEEEEDACSLTVKPSKQQHFTLKKLFVIYLF